MGEQNALTYKHYVSPVIVERTIGVNMKEDWYQRLEHNFFQLCKKRNIKGEARTVLIYLRGLYCAFRKPTFYCPDKVIIKDLNISRDTLRRSRSILRQRGIIDFKSYEGRGKAVDYVILKTELAPELKGTKFKPLVAIFKPFNSYNQAQKGTKIRPQDYKRVNKDYIYTTPKNRKSLTDSQRQELRQALKECKDRL